MRCQACNRKLLRAAAYLGGAPVGPICGERLGILPVRKIKVKRVKMEHTKRAVRLAQFDLFEPDSDSLTAPCCTAA